MKRLLGNAEGVKIVGLIHGLKLEKKSSITKSEDGGTKTKKNGLSLQNYFEGPQKE